MYSKLLSLGVEVSDLDLTNALTNVSCPIQRANIEMQIAIHSCTVYANRLISLGILESTKNKKTNNSAGKTNTYKHRNFLCKPCNQIACKGPSFCRERSNKTCLKCKKSGHTADSCLSNVRCHKCNKVGHISPNSKANSIKLETVKNTISCYTLHIEWILIFLNCVRYIL